MCRSATFDGQHCGRDDLCHRLVERVLVAIPGEGDVVGTFPCDDTMSAWEKFGSATDAATISRLDGRPMLAFDDDNKLRGISILSSRDTREHVEQVRGDVRFMHAPCM